MLLFAFQMDRDGKDQRNNVPWAGSGQGKRHFLLEKERGFFSFTVEDGFKEAPGESEYKVGSTRKAKRKEVDVLGYGDSFFLDGYLKSTPYYKVFRDIHPGSADIVMTLIYFYVLQGGAREYARSWWEGNYVSLLFPKAVPYGSKITGIYRKLADPDLQLRFSRNYLGAIISEAGIHGVLIDSTGVPNTISMDKREVWNHDGSCAEGARLIYVCERNTGMPLTARSISGNIIEASTIVNTISDLEASGVCTDFVILDAGYYTEENIKVLYDKEISFITRLKKNRKLYKDIFARHRKGLEDIGNMVSYNGRVLYIKKVPCIIRNHSAYAYLALDVFMQGVKASDSLSAALEDKEDTATIERIRNTCGTFMIISSDELDTSEVLPLYYTRQQVEQVFDLAKGYGELLQLGLHGGEAIEGHVFVSFLATIVCHILQKLFKDQKMNMVEALGVLRNHTCKVYNNGDIVPFEAKKKQNLCYDLIKVKPQAYHCDALPTLW